MSLLNQLRITYPAAFANSSDPISQYGVTALPSTFFFDGEGNLVNQRIGFIDEQTFEEILSNLIDTPNAGVGGNEGA